MQENNQNQTNSKHYEYLVSDNIEKNIRIDIDQVKQNLGMEFHIKENNQLLYKGYDNFIKNTPPIRFEDSNGKEVFTYHHAQSDVIAIDNYASKTGIIKNENNEAVGKFYQANYSINKYYCLQYNKQLFEIFTWSTGRNPHLSIFLNGKQIA